MQSLPVTEFMMHFSLSEFMLVVSSFLEDLVNACDDDDDDDDDDAGSDGDHTMTKTCERERNAVLQKNSTHERVLDMIYAVGDKYSLRILKNVTTQIGGQCEVIDFTNLHFDSPFFAFDFLGVMGGREAR